MLFEIVGSDSVPDDGTEMIYGYRCCMVMMNKIKEYMTDTNRTDETWDFEFCKWHTHNVDDHDL